MKLYYNPMSTYSQKVLMAFYEKDVAFEPMLVDLMNPEKKAEYKKIYPFGKAPCLVRSDGWMIPESSIIIEYLEGAFSTGTKLIPEDKDLARQTRFFDRMADLYVNDSVGTLFFGSLRSPEQQSESYFKERMQTMRNNLDVSYAAIHKTLEGKTWMMGDAFTMADCSLIPALGYARKTYPFDQYKNIVSYFGRGVERLSYQKVLKEATPLLEAFQKNMQR